MVTYKIHFECQDGTPDFFIISGDNIEDIKKLASIMVNKRDGKDIWSEEIK